MTPEPCALDRLACAIADAVAEAGLPADTLDSDEEWDVGSNRDVAEYLADAFQIMAEDANPPRTFARDHFIDRACKVHRYDAVGYNPAEVPVDV